MHPVFLTELTTDRQGRLLHEAATERLLRTGRRTPRRLQRTRWHLQSPIVRRPLATPYL